MHKGTSEAIKRNRGASPAERPGEHEHHTVPRGRGHTCPIAWNNKLVVCELPDVHGEDPVLQDTDKDGARCHGKKDQVECPTASSRATSTLVGHPGSTAK